MNLYRVMEVINDRDNVIFYKISNIVYTNDKEVIKEINEHNKKASSSYEWEEVYFISKDDILKLMNCQILKIDTYWYNYESVGLILVLMQNDFINRFVNTLYNSLPEQTKDKK